MTTQTMSIRKHSSHFVQCLTSRLWRAVLEALNRMDPDLIETPWDSPTFQQAPAPDAKQSRSKSLSSLPISFRIIRHGDALIQDDSERQCISPLRPHQNIFLQHCSSRFVCQYFLMNHCWSLLLSTQPVIFWCGFPGFNWSSVQYVYAEIVMGGDWWSITSTHIIPLPKLVRCHWVNIR